MCLILDTNRFGDALSDAPGPEYVPLLRWLTDADGDGTFALGGTKYRREIGKHHRALRFFREQVRAGRAITFEDKSVDDEEERLASTKACTSDDEHVVALARISGARVVCTEDQALWADIKNKALIDAPRGRVYRTADHVALLHHDSCCEKAPKKNRTATKRRRRGP